MNFLLLTFFLTTPSLFIQLVNTQCSLKAGETIPVNFPLPETTTAGSLITSLKVTPDVIDFTNLPSGGSDSYLEFRVESGELKVISKIDFSTYFDSLTSDVLQFVQSTLRCSGAPAENDLGVFSFKVEDFDNHPPRFDPSSKKSYLVDLPYMGAPINWNSFIKIKDGDFTNANTQIDVTIQNKAGLPLEISQAVRVPASEALRLQYYEVYFSFIKNGIIEPGSYAVNMDVTGKNDPIKTDSLELTLDLKRDDVQTPVILPTDYHINYFDNIINSLKIVATVTDDSQYDTLTISLTDIRSSTDFAKNFEVSRPTADGKIKLILKNEIAQNELKSVDFLVGLNLEVTDAAGHSVTLSIVLPFEPVCER